MRGVILSIDACTTGNEQQIDIYYTWEEGLEGSVYLYWKYTYESDGAFNDSNREIAGGDVIKYGNDYIFSTSLPYFGTFDYELYGQDAEGMTVFITHFRLTTNNTGELGIPGSPYAERGHKKLSIDWDDLEAEKEYDIVSYVVTLEDKCGKKEEEFGDGNKINHAIFQGVIPGDVYRFYIRAQVYCYTNIVGYTIDKTNGEGFFETPYNETLIGPDCFGWSITATPSRPYISAWGVVENRINFAWELEDHETNISEVVIELYSSGGKYIDAITDKSGNWYGDGCFEYVEDGDYYIRISANLNVNGTVLWALNDDAEKYYYKTDIITISNKKLFSWHNYNVNGLENFLESGSRVRYLTKDAWNGLLDFMERNCYVEDFAIPNDSDVYGDCADENYDAAINMCRMGENEGLLTSQIFNTVNYLVENMFGSAGIGLQYSKNPKYPVYASYFWNIQRAINERILEE